MDSHTETIQSSTQKVKSEVTASVRIDGRMADAKLKKTLTTLTIQSVK